MTFETEAMIFYTRIKNIFIWPRLQQMQKLANFSDYHPSSRWARLLGSIFQVDFLELKTVIIAGTETSRYITNSYSLTFFSKFTLNSYF